MGASVAGQIRIDLIANTARFKTDMRDAGQAGLGSFAEQYEKTVGRVRVSQKALAEDLQKRADGWKTAMRELRPEIRDKSGYDPRGNSRDMLGWYAMENRAATPVDQELRNQIRWKSMLPWGNSTRIELTREAALTAAAIGAGKQTVVRSLADARNGIAIELANASGLGGMVGMAGRFAAGHPLITAGAIVGGAMLKQVADHNALAREIKRQSRMLGQGTEDTSRMHAVGFDETLLARFQRSMAEQTPDKMGAFRLLGVNPNAIAGKPLIQTLTDVAAGFEKIKNPADRANVAMELFGRGGADVIATLSEMHTNMQLISKHEIISPEDIARVKAWDHALKEAGGALADISLAAAKKLGFQTGIGTQMGRMIEGSSAWWSKLIETGDVTEATNAMMKRASRWNKEEYNIAHADEIEKARVAQDGLANAAVLYAQAIRKADESLQSLQHTLLDLEKGEGAGARQKWIEDRIADGLGRKPGELPAQTQKYDTLLEKIRFARAHKRAEEDYEAATTEGPEGKLKKRTQDLDMAYGMIKRSKEEEERLQFLKLKYLRDYYREAEGLDAKAIRKRLVGAHGEYLEGLRNLRAHGGLAGLTPDEINREASRRRDDERKRLGVDDPLGDFAKAVKELREAVASGDIKPKEFDRLVEQRRKSAVSALIAEKPAIHLNAAMAAGSAEARSLIVNTQTDPRTRAAIKAAEALNEVVNLIQAGNAISEETLRMLQDAII